MIKIFYRRYPLLWTVLSSLLIALQASAVPVKIQPLGDSITICGPGQMVPCVSYRYPLFKLLAAANIDVDFVGSVIDPNSYAAVNGKVFPPHYEGHWGYKIESINAGLPGWMSSYSLDWSIIMLGSNHLPGESASSVKSKMSATIDLLRAKNPNVVIFISLPCQPVNEYPSYAFAFRQLAAERTTATSPIISVGPPKAWNPAIHTLDGGHPNAAGADLLAATLFEAITSYLAPSNTHSSIKIDGRPAQSVQIMDIRGFYKIKLPVQQAFVEIVDISGRIVSTTTTVNGAAFLPKKNLNTSIHYLRVTAPGCNLTVPLH